MNIKKLFFINKLKSRIKKSITWKLFIITALFFIIFISSTLIIQSLFFEKFYVNKKRSNLENKIEKFKINYSKAQSYEKVVELMREFEENSNTKIVILDNQGKLKFIIKSANEKVDASRLRIINDFIKKWVINEGSLDSIKRQHHVITMITPKGNNEIRTIVCAIPENVSGDIIFAVSSLQPVNEASSVIKEFYLYFYVGAVILIVLLCSAYSNMISKPLIKLNHSASKMAELDFTQKCLVTSEDEIGNLASNLNFLSTNLNHSLSSLKKANAKLEEDIEKERNLEKMRKEFVAAVSHELKTPISLIEGYAEGIKDGIFEDEEKDYYIDVIIDESKKMGSLVYDMLDLSQLESGNFKLVKEKFFIDILISTTIKKFSAIMEEKQICLYLNNIKDVKVHADWTRMEQVLTNFITNAIRYTNEKGIIKVGMEETLEGIKVFVENSGEHIIKEEMNKLWDNFYKIDKARNRQLGGTGLGLAIVKNILILHGYGYGVENTETGVKFYFTINKIYEN